MSRLMYPILSSECICSTIASLSEAEGGSASAMLEMLEVGAPVAKPIESCDPKVGPFLPAEPNVKGALKLDATPPNPWTPPDAGAEVEEGVPKKDKLLVAMGIVEAPAPTPTPAPAAKVTKDEPNGLLLPDGGKRPDTPLLDPLATGNPDGATSCTALPNRTVAVAVAGTVAGTLVVTGTGVGATATSASSSTTAKGIGVEEGTRSSMATSSTSTSTTCATSTCIFSLLRSLVVLLGATTGTAGTGTD